MEVHHHPKAEKKSFKEYFFEFLMIFLAVTLGFFAENIREYISNKENEKVYMESLMEDIRNDVITIKESQKIFEQRISLLDSLINSLGAPVITANTSNLYYYARLATKNDPFFSNTRTFDQLKSTGAFKLIKNKAVAESIMSYYSTVEQLKPLESIAEEGEFNEYRKIAVEVFDARIFNEINSASMNLVSRPPGNPPLRTNDKKLLGDLAGWAHYIKNTRIGVYQYTTDVLEKGEKLIQQIQKEYHLK